MSMAADILKEKMRGDNFRKFMALDNGRLQGFVADAIELTRPESVFVCTDDPADVEYIRQLAIKNGEEKPLAIPGHTIHFDGYSDQGRDKDNTRFLLPADSQLGAALNSMDKEAGTREIRSIFSGIMAGRQMLVCFYCLGPTNSAFSIPCVQITDSPYVAHSEGILYRTGYEQFKKEGPRANFFRFLHSEGKLENAVSVDVANRRVYIDLEEELVYSVNTQYAGNTVGLKKLALRLGIQRADREKWLAEHMFIMGVNGPNKRVTYFTGAFPSACGKTSTSMLPGQKIVGDDIAYFRKIKGEVRTVNVEKGIFGIIQDVNPTDDPLIYQALTSPCEVIFSNVLYDDKLKPYWLGMGCEYPTAGINHSGKWKKGNKDAKGNEITISHKNARYCLNISELGNMDPRMEDPEGVPVGGVIYGGRDSDTCVPVEQAFDWTEGIIIKGACLESETTSATLGAEGVRKFNLMSNLDFVSVPLGRYIQNNLDFVKDVKKPPSVFSVNYFLKNKEGKYLNGMMDKLVWLFWAELRVNGDVGALRSPTGFIPKYDDLARLFKEKLHKDYTRAQYIEQFSHRIPGNLAKLDRVEKIYKEQVPDTPQILFDTFDKVRGRLTKAQRKYGDTISPFDLPG